MHLEDEISRLALEYPYIACFGESMDNLQDSCVVVENNIMQMPSVNMAVHCCFGAYWVFGMKYPPCARYLLLFLENVVYELPISQRLPTSVITMIDSLTKCDLAK